MSTPIAATVFTSATPGTATGNLSSHSSAAMQLSCFPATREGHPHQFSGQQYRTYTYYSSVPVEQTASPKYSGFSLPTPPLSSSLQHFKNHFFPVGQPIPTFSLQQDKLATSTSPDTKTAATLLQLHEPVVRQIAIKSDLSSMKTIALANQSPPQAQTPCIDSPTEPAPISSSFSNISSNLSSPKQPIYHSAHSIVQTPYASHFSQTPSHPCWHSTWPYIPLQSSHDLRSNSCHICGKTYARISTLRSHLKSHSGEKPYQCSICQKSFTQAANLTAHLRTHSGEKPFKCPVCHRGFSQSSSVTTHMRTHSGDRPYKCSVCNKGFADSSTLTKHYRTHTGEKPYQCKICEARFSQSGNLNRHMRTHRHHFPSGIDSSSNLLTC